MKIVQIKGSNGSGKTTIVKQMLALEPDPIYGMWDHIGKYYATIMPTIGWVAVGEYDLDRKMGGCDGLSSVQLIKDAILDCMAEFIEYDGMFGIVFEGMMISTIKSTFYDFLLSLETPYIEPLFVILAASPKGCIERIRNRGTMRKNLNHDNIRSKCELVMRHAKTYDQKYVRYIDVDNTEERDMLKAFAGRVGDYRLVMELEDRPADIESFSRVDVDG